MSLDPEGRTVEQGRYFLFAPGLVWVNPDCVKHRDRLRLSERAIAAAFDVEGLATLDCGCRLVVCGEGVL